jgi:hypothetical protein
MNFPSYWWYQVLFYTFLGIENGKSCREPSSQFCKIAGVCVRMYELFWVINRCGVCVQRYELFWDTPQKMTVLQKFYLVFVPEWHFCGVSLRFKIRVPVARNTRFPIFCEVSVLPSSLCHLRSVKGQRQEHITREFPSTLTSQIKIFIVPYYIPWGHPRSWNFQMNIFI